jgi:ubiquinone/menaquinone biosynthesis C-methylase UbiE
MLLNAEFFRNLLELIGRVVLWSILALLVVQLGIRILRWFVKFPIPSVLVRFIDNPFRRRIQVPQQLVESLDVHEGMHLLEIGPGSGTYTQAFCESVGQDGFIVTIDIEMTVLSGLQRRMIEIGADKVYPLIADVHHLPFGQTAFDAVYMITVIGEIPSPNEAFKSFFRVLKPAGKLMFSELLLDPDFTLPRTLRAWANQSSFQFHDQQGNLLTYTITFLRSG